MKGRQIWTVALFMVLPYLFDDKTVIAFCVFTSDGQRWNGRGCLVLQSTLCIGKVFCAVELKRVCNY